MKASQVTLYIQRPPEVQCFTRWRFEIFFIFTPKIGEDEPILTNIFRRG